MDRRRVVSLAVVLGLVYPSPAWPQGRQLAESPAELVSAQRIPERPTNPFTLPSNTTVITAEEVRVSGASTLPELLGRAEGIHITDAQGFSLGADNGVNLRGINNGSRTGALVLVDGVPQNRITGDEVHWQAIPLRAIDRIEIIRGAAAALYGDGALSGVISIFTTQGAAKRLETEVSAEAGSFGWQRYVLAANGSAQPLTYGASYTRWLLRGYREYSSTRTTNVTAHAGATLIPGMRFAVNTLHSEDTTAFPGGLTAAEAKLRRKQAVMSRVGIFDEMSDQISADLTLGPYEGVTSLISAYWRDQEVDSLRSGLYTLTPSRGLSLRSIHEWTIGVVGNTLATGFELRDEKASTGTRGDGRTDESNHQGYGTYLQNTVTVWDRVSVTAGFRYDRSKFDEDVVAFDSNFNPVNYVGTLHFEGKSPFVGATVTLVPERLNLFAGYGRPFKAPNVDDFASRTPEFQGNVSLRPQQADAFEVGARSSWPFGELKTTAFYTKIQDEIIFVQGIPGNPFVFRNENFDTRRFGVENAARIHLDKPRLRGYATYTFVDAEFRKGQFDNRTIPITPEHLVTAGIGHSPLDGLWVDLDWRLVQDFFRINDFTNTLPSDNYGVLNVLLQYAVPEARRGWPAARAYLKFENVTNEQYGSFQSSNGHTFATGAGERPMPPFGVIAGVDFDF